MRGPPHLISLSSDTVADRRGGAASERDTFLARESVNDQVNILGSFRATSAAQRPRLRQALRLAAASVLRRPPFLGPSARVTSLRRSRRRTSTRSVEDDERYPGHTARRFRRCREKSSRAARDTPRRAQRGVMIAGKRPMTCLVSLHAALARAASTEEARQGSPSATVLGHFHELRRPTWQMALQLVVALARRRSARIFQAHGAAGAITRSHARVVSAPRSHGRE